MICFIAQIDGTLAVPWPNLWRRAVGDKGMKGADVKVTGMIYIYIYSTHRYTNLFITVTYIHFISFRERNAKKETSSPWRFWVHISVEMCRNQVPQKVPPLCRLHLLLPFCSDLSKWRYVSHNKGGISWLLFLLTFQKTYLLSIVKRWSLQHEQQENNKFLQNLSEGTGLKMKLWWNMSPVSNSQSDCTLHCFYFGLF